MNKLAYIKGYIEGMEKTAITVLDLAVASTALGIPIGAVAGAISAGKDNRLRGARHGAWAGAAGGTLGSVGAGLAFNKSLTTLAGFGAGSVGAGVVAGKLVKKLKERREAQDMNKVAGMDWDSRWADALGAGVFNIPGAAAVGAVRGGPGNRLRPAIEHAAGAGLGGLGGGILGAAGGALIGGGIGAAAGAQDQELSTGVAAGSALGALLGTVYGQYQGSRIARRILENRMKTQQGGSGMNKLAYLQGYLDKNAISSAYVDKRMFKSPLGKKLVKHPIDFFKQLLRLDIQSGNRATKAVKARGW